MLRGVSRRRVNRNYFRVIPPSILKSCLFGTATLSTTRELARVLIHSGELWLGGGHGIPPNPNEYIGTLDDMLINVLGIDVQKVRK